MFPNAGYEVCVQDNGLVSPSNVFDGVHNKQITQASYAACVEYVRNTPGTRLLEGVPGWPSEKIENNYTGIFDLSKVEKAEDLFPIEKVYSGKI